MKIRFLKRPFLFFRYAKRDYESYKYLKKNYSGLWLVKVRYLLIKFDICWSNKAFGKHSLEKKRSLIPCKMMSGRVRVHESFALCLVCLCLLGEVFYTALGGHAESLWNELESLLYVKVHDINSSPRNSSILWQWKYVYLCLTMLMNFISSNLSTLESWYKYRPEDKALII